MKKIYYCISCFFALLFLFSKPLNAYQKDTTFYSLYESELTANRNYTYYELNNGKDRSGKVKLYTPDHKLYGQITYVNNEPQGPYELIHSNGTVRESGLYDVGFKVGLRTRYYFNGVKSMEQIVLKRQTGTNREKMVNAWDSLGNQTVFKGNGSFKGFLDPFQKTLVAGKFKDGFRYGSWTAERNGKLRYKERFGKNGVLKKGTYYADNGKTYNYSAVEEQASFPGGPVGWQQFLVKNLKYPESGIDTNTEGDVWISCFIDTDGSLSDSKVIRGPGNGLNEEALRVMRMSRKWTPGKQRGVPVKSRMRIAISFRLN